MSYSIPQRVKDFLVHDGATDMRVPILANRCRLILISSFPDIKIIYLIHKNNFTLKIDNKPIGVGKNIEECLFNSLDPLIDKSLI